MSGYNYYLVVVNDFSHYSWTFPLRAKSETFPTLHFFAWVFTQFGLTIKAIQCDEREFDNSTSRSFFLSLGVFSCVYLVHIPLPRTARLSG